MLFRGNISLRVESSLYALLLYDLLTAEAITVIVDRFARRLLGFPVADWVSFLLAGAVEQPVKVIASSRQEVAVLLHHEAVAVLLAIAEHDHVDICKAIIAAESEGKLLTRQANIARQAHLIIGASAKAGIKGLAYALAGYNPIAEEVIAAFKLYVQEEARDYEKEFPSQLYKEWYRLYQLPKPDRNRPSKFKHLTVNHVWHPLARSHGRILELTKAERAKSVIRHKRLHQFLSAIGVKALRMHLGQLLGIAQVSNDEKEYERHVSRIFGDQMELDV